METLNQIIEWGVATLALPGQSESGDRHMVKAFPDGCLVAVVDGLGHGEEACKAAKLAVQTLEGNAHESVIALLLRCHETLRSTRGVVMSMASFNYHDGTMTWLGVGNVEGFLQRADPAAKPPRESLLLRNGMVGTNFDRPYASIIPLMRGDTLILATDGVRNTFAQTLNHKESPQRMAERILSRHAKGNDDALVLVVRYQGCLP